MDDQREPEPASQLESPINFAGFTLDLRGERVLQGTEPVKLRRKCFQALCLLADNPGRVVTKEELLERLWPDCVVGEDSLHQCIRELRKNLGDNTQQIIRTAPGRGYALAAAVSSPLSDTPAQVQAVAPNRNRNAWIYLAGALLVLALAGLALSRRSPQAEGVRSLAVSPFVMADGDATNAYIGESLAESVTSSLSRHHKVRVLAFDSTWRIHREKPDTQSVGRRLGVDAVVAGRIRRQADGLVVGVELVRVHDNTQLWGKQYRLKIEDLPSLESEIAYDVLAQLGDGKGQSENRASTRATPRPEAYVELLKGRHEQRKRSPLGIRTAVEHFQRAVELDPGFAGAWAAMADVRYNQFIASDSPRQNLSKLGKEAALKALVLDDSVGEAHAIMGAFRFIEEFDWLVAESEFKRAIDLTPFAGSIYLRYSMMLLAMGRVSEALSVATRAQEVDPLSPVLHSWKANVQFVSANFQESIEEGQKSLALDAKFGLGHLVLGRSYVQLGQYREGLMELNKAREMLDRNWRPLGDLAYAYGVSGDRAMARTIMKDMMDRRAESSFPALPIAMGYAGLAELDEAFVWLRKAVDERGSELWMKTDPRFATLRSDARFTQLLHLMKLQ